MFEQDFLGFINDNRLADPAGRTLLAVSGGLDSTVMAELFYRANLPVAIAHVNFGLRGQESDDDAEFVEQMARRFSVPFHKTRFDTAQIADERGVSIQMAARDLRYQWFGAIRAECGYVSVATAHHQNDVLETLLLNLTRGTGLSGLHGIAVRQEHAQLGLLIRPMLFTNREQIAQYAAENQISYREDRSNADDYYARNRIRHQVIPVLNTLNPGLWNTLPRTVERLRSADNLLKQELERSWQQLFRIKPDGAILLPVESLTQLNEGQFRLSEWLKPFGFSVDQSRQIWSALARDPGQVFRSATHQLIHERAGLLISLFTEGQLTSFETGYYSVVSRPNSSWIKANVTVSLMDKSDSFMPDPDPAIAWLDADRLTLPLTVRLWQQGDRFRPLGLSGTKLVSDLLNDLKLDTRERASTVVALSGDEIVWVVGRRIGHKFRVRADTRRLARLSFTSQI